MAPANCRLLRAVPAPPTERAASFMTSAHPTSYHRRAVGTSFGDIAGRMLTQNTTNRDCGKRNPQSYYAWAVRVSSHVKTVLMTFRSFSTAIRADIQIDCSRVVQFSVAIVSFV